MDARMLAEGPGWSAWDLVCRAGPRDRPYEERHASACLALVTEGTFRYRTFSGSAMLAPGAVLLGDRDACFECGHRHAAGDRCVSFHFGDAYLESIVADVPGVRRARFDAPRLPPSPETARLAAAIEFARDEADPGALEEAGLRLAGAAFALLAGRVERHASLGAREARLISQAVRRIEATSTEALPLATLAGEAGINPYRFLRLFKRVVGMTPHQYVLRVRLHRAALRLRRSRDPVLTIAVEEGFNDLSTFVRRFRRVMGVSPRVYRMDPRRAPLTAAPGEC
jgi:AraC-like DNA-binding protein